MPRSIWNGVISFGMVSIPVKLYTATEDKDISFHQLHQACGSRLKQLRWCPVCDREVEWGEVTRGYEYAKEQHIVLSEEDLGKLPLPSKRSIERDMQVLRARALAQRHACPICGTILPSVRWAALAVDHRARGERARAARVSAGERKRETDFAGRTKREPGQGPQVGDADAV